MVVVQQQFNYIIMQNITGYNFNTIRNGMRECVAGKNSGVIAPSYSVPGQQ